MADIELVEKLRERADVTYDEAKEALNVSGGDLLDAIIYLEKMGKVPPPSGGGSYSSLDAPSSESGYTVYEGKGYKGRSSQNDADTFSEWMGRFWKWLKKMLKKSLVNMFEIRKDGQTLFSMHVLAFIALMCIFNYLALTLLVVGLFFGFRYKFMGPSDPVNINNIMEEVANVTENLKNEMKRAIPRDRE